MKIDIKNNGEYEEVYEFLDKYLKKEKINIPVTKKRKILGRSLETTVSKQDQIDGHEEDYKMTIESIGLLSPKTRITSNQKFPHELSEPIMFGIWAYSTKKGYRFKSKKS